MRIHQSDTPNGLYANQPNYAGWACLHRAKYNYSMPLHKEIKMNQKQFLVYRTIFIAFLISSVLLSACQTTATPHPTVEVRGEVVNVQGGSYTNVTPLELDTMLTSKDFTLINVHTPFEGKIAQTDLSIPYDQIKQNLDKLPTDKNARLVLYCRSGHMSDIAAKTLLAAGYTNIWNLDGGMVAWENAGFQIEH
jgi:rhodanese-related sulfurtransferase